MITFTEEHLRNAQDRVNSLLSSLPNAAILYLLGVVNAPCIGENVAFTMGGNFYRGNVKSVNLKEGIATVEYTHTITRYKKADDDGTSQSWKNSTYTVPFNMKEKTSDDFEFRYLEF